MDILLSGVGGQGTVLASRLLAECAMQKGLNVRTAETLGMAQRGGSVVSHVRSGKFVNSPLLPLNSADLIIGFEVAEALRSLPYLSQNGAVLVNNYAVQPASSPYDKQEFLDCINNLPNKKMIVNGEEICNACGSSKVLNIALIGVACGAGYLEYTLDELKTAIDVTVPEKFRDLNKKAIEIGYNWGTEK